MTPTPNGPTPRQVEEALKAADERTESPSKMAEWLRTLAAAYRSKAVETGNNLEACVKAVREAEAEGCVLINDGEGVIKVNLADLMKQPLDGVLYDLNRLPEVCLTFIDDPTWINNFALTKVAVWLDTELRGSRERLREMEGELNNPETAEFLDGVRREAAHQRQRWEASHDEGKGHADWFWLVGYLAGKCLASALSGNFEKAKHHAITTAAALYNWHAAFMEIDNRMQPASNDAVDSARALSSNEGEKP